MAYTYIDEDRALQQYRDEIDELHDIEICGMSFCASRILEELDPIAFNCGFSDWLDANELTTEEEEEDEEDEDEEEEDEEDEEESEAE